MTDTDMEAALTRELGRIAPKIDIDSMDFLTLVAALSSSLGIDTLEADYARMSTVEDLLAYLRARTA